MKKIAVIGAGITGMSSALYASHKGYDVTIYDKNRYAAMETSFANGASFQHQMQRFGQDGRRFFKGLKWMLKPDAPLLVNPKPSSHKFGWMFEFMKNIKYEINTIRTAELAMASRDFMTEMAEDAGIEFPSGQSRDFAFYDDEYEFKHAHHVTQMLAKGGLSRQRLTPDEVRAIEPSIQSDIIGGYYTRFRFYR